MDYKNIKTSPSVTAKVILGLKELGDEWVCQYAAKRLEKLEKKVEELKQELEDSEAFNLMMEIKEPLDKEQIQKEQDENEMGMYYHELND